LMFVCCVLSGRERSLRRAGHSSRGVLRTVACRCVWSRNLVWWGHSPRWAKEPQKIFKKLENYTKQRGKLTTFLELKEILAFFVWNAPSWRQMFVV
jgi:hypothetical protein